MSAYTLIDAHKLHKTSK